MTRATGLFVDPAAVELAKPPIQQIMREHVLVQASIMRGDHSEGRFVVIAPELNLPVQTACTRYREHLVAPTDQKAGFATWTLERFVDVLREHGDPDYAAALFRRYLDWSLIDDEIEASFPAKLAR